MTLLIGLMFALIVLCLVASFMLSLSEASLLSVSPHEMQKAARAGNRRAQMVLAVTERGDYLHVFVVCNNALVLVMSTLMTLIVRQYTVESPSSAGVLDTVAHIGMVVSILIFGELLPKTYGSLRPGPSSLAIAGIMERLVRLLAPMVRLMTWISNGILRAGGVDVAYHRHFVTADEIRAAADLGEEEGTVQPDEGEMLDSVMELGERSVRDIMIPRVDMVALPEDATLEDLVEAAVESGFSRIPVYRESIDHVTGVVYVNDILATFSRGERHVTLAEVARVPILAPESKPLDEMLGELRQQKVHIAIVIDEFGGTEGLVTIEDILEELVGEIEDEHDLPEPEVLVTAEGEAIVQGKARIEEINELLGLSISTDNHDTISGFLTGMAGRVPQDGEVLTADGASFVVVESNGQHVDRLRVIALPMREAEL
ncbi:MAG: HlyC/CorC family transporter [candidate division WS1 bacterium]|nr:HlyC/CorC family transporter [candidate division WS1 bacterium]